MALQDLPTELLVKILNFIGADQLRHANLARIYLFKQWYYAALVTLMKEVYIKGKNLELFPPQSSEHMRTLSTTVIRIDINLAYPHKSVPSEEKIEEKKDQKPRSQKSEDEEELNHETEILAMATWSGWVQAQVRRINGFLSKCSNLKEVSFQSTFSLPEDTATSNLSSENLMRGPLILDHNITALTSLSNLTSLTLCCLGLPEIEGSEHLCTTLAARLLTLRYLDLALGRICSRVFEIPSISATSSEASEPATKRASTACPSPTATSKLQEIIIRLSIKVLESQKLHMATSCDTTERSGLSPLRSSMIRAMKALVQATPSVVTAKLVWTGVSDNHLHVKDFILGELRVYNSDGEVVMWSCYSDDDGASSSSSSLGTLSEMSDSVTLSNIYNEMEA